jgi:NitT/TauT family transport system substrate-binding protein
MISPRCKRFLLLMATVLATIGCQHDSSSEPGLIKVTLQTDWYPEPEHGGFFTALVKGYYKDAGLDVAIVPLGPYLDADKPVSSGSAQFGMQAADHVLEAIANGQPLVAIAATM